MDENVKAELLKLDDGIPFRAKTDHVHATWARTFHSSPDLYIRPQSLPEIEKVTTLARRCRKRLTTVGCGHSPSNITCTSSWLVNLDDYNKILSVDKTSCVAVVQAGIRLYHLGEELDRYGLAMPNLGSINQQSIAGAISTGTHGSTLKRSILSSSVLALRITLSNSRTISCSPTQNPELFRAALLSLGCLGIITEITFQATPAFSLHWQQRIWPDKHIFETWADELFQQAEFVRVWWFPYTRRATVWHAQKTTRPESDIPFKAGYYDGAIGYHIYHNLLALSLYVPRILPWVEWFVFGMQYGFGTGDKTLTEAIQPSRKALLMNCLYSQYVNEWAIPFRDGPTAIRRLSSWLNHLQPSDPDYVEHGIPFSARGLYVHAPLEVRVSDTTIDLYTEGGERRPNPRPYLDPTCDDGPTLYLNATLYRPYLMDPPCRARYYEGFEWLMRDMGGKPHWAKNFETTGSQIEAMYGKNLEEFRRIRNDADPEGMFVGTWHRELILGDTPRLPLEEVEIAREPASVGGVHVTGSVNPYGAEALQTDRRKMWASASDDSDDGLSGPTDSEESFDLLRASDTQNAGDALKTPGNAPPGHTASPDMEQSYDMLAMNPSHDVIAGDSSHTAVSEGDLNSIQAPSIKGSEEEPRNREALGKEDSQLLPQFRPSS